MSYNPPVAQEVREDGSEQESRRRCARGAADEPPPLPAHMTAEQATRSADQAAAILRGLAAAYEAARLEAQIAWYCAPNADDLAPLDRASDLGEASAAIVKAMTLYVAYGSAIFGTLEREARADARGLGPTPYTERANAYLVRVAEHVRNRLAWGAALHGEPLAIPSSDGLGPYPPPSAP